jgi:hypothetical protein
MNARIRELADEAGLRFTQLMSNPMVPVVDGKETDLEKFAEAIIRECCIALNPMLRDMISRGQGVDMIKLHFGMNPNEITTRMLDTAIDQMTKQLAEKKHDS